ncbi:PQQ-binding-like beta-propeller repeat protein, partial [bacterium]|nr:PQQ-binding-like beta-propeller repeat protein [bacterium]
PVVVDGKAVFVPRDRLGIFALDAATGAPVWDNVYVPSHGVAGRLGELLVTYDSRHAAALDVASGAVRWHRRFDAALAAAPRMVGTTLLVGLPTGLVSLDARTGRRLAEVPWGSQGAMGAFVVRDGHIVGTSTEPVGFESADVGRPLAKGAPSADGGLALPMAQVWRLPRSGPRLLETPQELDGNLYLLSEGMLECVEATERGGVRWRRAVPLGAGRVRWAQGRLVLTFPGRAFAIDGKTGKLLWETALPFHVRKVVLAPPHLFLGSWDAARRHWRMASLDLATGALEWENDLRELVRHGNDGVREAVWDGGDKMILFARLTYGKAAHYTLPVSLKDGRLLGMKKFRDGEKWMRLFVGDKTGGFYVDDHKQGWAFTLDGGVKHVRYKANFGKIYDRPTSLRGSFDGPWLHINQQIAYPDSRTHWVLKRGDPAYELIRPQFGTSRGARLYEADGQTLVMTDLASRKELARYTVGGGRGRKVDILGHHAAKGRLLVVSGVYGGKAWDPEPRGLRLDLFEEGTGRLLAGQTLEGPAYWNLAHSYAYDYREDERSQVVFRKGVLYLTDMHGLQAYAPEPAAQRVDTPRPLVYRAEKSPVLDGSLAEWGGAETVSLRGPAGQKGTLKLTHDDRSLFLGVTCPDRDPRPRVGRGDHGGGDWLEVALTTRDSSHRWGLGLDA